MRPGPKLNFIFISGLMQFIKLSQFPLAFKIYQKKSCCGLVLRLTVSSLKGHKESFTFVSSPGLFFIVNSNCLEHGSFKHIF